MSDDDTSELVEDSINQCCKRLFNTPDGERFLDHLCRRHFLDQSTLSPDPHTTSHNEGRRFVVLNILHQMREGPRAATPRKPWHIVRDFILGRKPKTP